MKLLSIIYCGSIKALAYNPLAKNLSEIGTNLVAVVIVVVVQVTVVAVHVERIVAVV